MIFNSNLEVNLVNLILPNVLNGSAKTKNVKILFKLLVSWVIIVLSQIVNVQNKVRFAKDL